MEKEQWIVLEAETTDDEGGLWSAATLFDSLDDAKLYVDNVIRTEWCTQVRMGDQMVLLADLKGYVYPEGCRIKHSGIYYSDDGTEAWVDPAADFMGHNIKICKVGEKGRRIC